MSITIISKKDAATPVSCEHLMQRADALTKDSSSAIYSALLHDLAKAKLDGIQTEKVLDAISKGLGCPLKIIRAEYKDIKNKIFNSNDIGLLIARRVLKEKYAAGSYLKRNTDGCYYFFDKTHWRLTSADVVRSNIQKIANDYILEADTTLAALVSNAMRCLDDLLASDNDILGMTETPFPIINCKNAELWLKKDGTFEPRPHQPTSRLLSCPEYEYVSDAGCPTFDKSIREIFANSSNPEEMVRHFEEIMGYAISGQRHIPLFIMLVGHGRNGKSKLLETLQRLIGQAAVLCDSLATFQNDRFNMAALHGKLLFCDDDLKQGIILNDRIIKILSEIKILSARHPYGKKKFNFLSRIMTVIASNDYPNTDDISPGMIRRAYIVPFDRQFTVTEDDKGLFPAIWENEMPGILNRALQGLKRLTERGGFLQPADCIRAGKEFFAHANPLYAFLTDFTVKDPDAQMKVKDFRNVFAAWAKSQGIAINQEDKKLLRKLRGLQNEFGYTVTKDVTKVAYPLLHGLAFVKESFLAENVS